MLSQCGSDQIIESMWTTHKLGSRISGIHDTWSRRLSRRKRDWCHGCKSGQLLLVISVGGCPILGVRRLNGPSITAGCYWWAVALDCDITGGSDDGGHSLGLFCHCSGLCTAARTRTHIGSGVGAWCSIARQGLDTGCCPSVHDDRGGLITDNSSDGSQLCLCDGYSPSHILVS